MSITPGVDVPLPFLVPGVRVRLFDASHCLHKEGDTGTVTLVESSPGRPDYVRVAMDDGSWCESRSDCLEALA